LYSIPGPAELSAARGYTTDHLVDRLFYRSFKLQGRYEFPPFLGMFIEQMLYLI